MRVIDWLILSAVMVNWKNKWLLTLTLRSRSFEGHDPVQGRITSVSCGTSFIADRGWPQLTTTTLRPRLWLRREFGSARRGFWLLTGDWGPRCGPLRFKINKFRNETKLGKRSFGSIVTTTDLSELVKLRNVLDTKHLWLYLIDRYHVRYHKSYLWCRCIS